MLGQLFQSRSTPRRRPGHNPRAKPSPTGSANRFSHKFWYYPGQVRQPALLRLRAVHHELPDADRHPGVIRVMGAPKEAAAVIGGPDGADGIDQ